ncbi:MULTISPECIES: DUF262 domain-containing protein [unclassified Methylophilus]|uniref:DUF262 domain-containing protein n=1 Tax=unclassified Methylophilus TaxID=2630143 RepID=UPI0009EA3476|nr:MULTISPECIES: DUF262 domain-containing protein [unclassified Methylophilus]
MSKTLVAHEQSLSKIFSDDYVFQIPGYQRPYSWTTEQARELFEDLIGFMSALGGPVESMPPYFLGSIVLIKDEANPKADVVDGQQRLTTLTILLSAIRAFVTEGHAKEITPLLYEQGSAIRGTKDRFRLTLRERDKDFFHQYIQRETGFSDLISLNDTLSNSQANIKANAILFAERIEKLSETERLSLAQFIVTRCYLVVVATPDIDSAYRIFSVLNSRGLDLSATDILKAQIIGNIPDTLKEAYTQKWEDAEEDLTRDHFGDLFSHIRMVYRKSKPKGTLIKEFSEHVTEIKQPAIFIDSVLLPMARAYEEILDANYESNAHAEQVNEHLKWLKRLEFSDWVPPALAFMARFRQKPDAMLAFFRDLERLAYAMLVTKFGINERIDRFSRLTQHIENANDLYDAHSPLQLSATEKFNLYSKLDGPIYEALSARARSALLLRLDSLLSGGGAIYEYDTVTVEHVLPQTPLVTSKWIEWFPEAKDRILWTHRIGNLALLTRKKNSAASNYEFDIKKRAYFTRNGISPFVLTTQVLDKGEWSINTVEARQRELLSVFENYWRLADRKSPLQELEELLGLDENPGHSLNH